MYTNSQKILVKLKNIFNESLIGAPQYFRKDTQILKDTPISTQIWFGGSDKPLIYS